MTEKQSVMPVLTPEARRTVFDEVALGYAEEQAKKEAERCMNCPAKYCKASCPLHNDIPQMMEYVRQGDYEAAYRCIRQTSPMPEVCSRVCAQENQCQKNCTRAIRSEAVGIGAVERFVSDWAAKNGIQEEQAKGALLAKVAVIGAGPAGIACALTLAQAGCAVTVYEKENYVGGVPYYGIPSFVLPKEYSAQQIEKMQQAGVTVCTGSPVHQVSELLEQGCDAVFVAIGAGQGVRMGIEGEDLEGVYLASDYLKEVNTTDSIKEPIASAKRVIVVGGGDTAIDVARCAVRLGAEEVTILYRRTVEDMPARKGDIDQALEEGISLVTLTNPVSIEAADGAFKVNCIDMQSGEEEYPGGRRKVSAIEGSNSSREADLVVFALGYQPEPVEGVPVDAAGRILTAHDRITTQTDRVYAGGDVVTGANTVAGAAAAGVAAAQEILRKM
jgi:glutamate synthase (NADPH/NADH) small chain